MFAAAGAAASVIVLESPTRTARAVRQALDRDAAVVVAGGGDGTVSGVAGELVGTHVPLGVLPMGTLNHFAKDLGLPLDLAEAVHVTVRGTVSRVDVGQVNGRVFLNHSSIGVYPKVVELRRRWESTGLGKWVAAPQAV